MIHFIILPPEATEIPLGEKKNAWIHHCLWLYSIHCFSDILNHNTHKIFSSSAPTHTSPILSFIHNYIASAPIFLLLMMVSNVFRSQIPFYSFIHSLILHGITKYIITSQLFNQKLFSSGRIHIINDKTVKHVIYLLSLFYIYASCSKNEERRLPCIIEFCRFFDVL